MRGANADKDAARGLPALESFRAGVPALGGHPFANWVVPGRLIAGGYPVQSSDEAATGAMQAAMVGAGVTAVVCLQPDRELRALPDYSALPGPLAAVPRLVFPIPDGGCADDAELTRQVLLPILRGLVQAPEGGPANCCYVHCLAGKGRTGTVCAILLGALYDLSSVEALDLIQRFFESRTDPFAKGGHSPENSSQRSQVTRILHSPKLRPLLLQAAALG